uniref:DDE_Tnp_ISL3 domain-containing protein n=1 Tax=Heterorhabditis bacteriophora TaxID=37862 RepID=A0A1I7W7Y7_HETBA
MNSELYCRIIEDFYILFLKNVYNNNARIVQDNDPKHTSKESRPQSIEKVWHQLKHYLRTEYKPVSKDTLIAGIRQFWKTCMTVDQCCRYIGQIHKAMKIVCDVNGEHSAEDGCHSKHETTKYTTAPIGFGVQTN